MSRQLWIDLLRGFCMLMIIFDHTEVCFTGKNIIPYELYVPDVLMTFFFLSGYLFYRPDGFQVRHKLMSVLRSLVMPYFIFVALLAVPKAFLHGNAVAVSAMAWRIVSGHESWFIAALVVCELVFSLILWLTKEKVPILMVFLAIAMALNIIVGSGNMLLVTDYWHINEASIALVYIIFGYLCHRYCGSIHLKKEKRAIAISMLLVALLCMKWYTYGHLEHSVSVYALVWPYCSLLSVTVSVMLLFILFSMIPQGKAYNDTVVVSALSWVGRRSLVYYFFCSGIPTALTVALAKARYTYQGHHLEVIPIFFLNVVIITLVVWIVYRYFPWMTGKRRQTL